MGMDKLTEAERHLYFWKHQRLGHFFSALFEAIQAADINNRALLSRAYPEHVEVVHKFQNVDGYWEDLLKRMAE